MAGCLGHCAQQILFSLADELGITEEEATGTGACLGIGMGNAETCGCYTAGLVALGLRYGSTSFAEADGRRPFLVRKLTEFEERFAALSSHRVCRDILEVDLTRGDGMAVARESGVVERRCPPLINATTGLLLDMFAQDGKTDE